MHNSSFQLYVLVRFVLFIPLTYGHRMYTEHLIWTALFSVLWLLLSCCLNKTNSHTHTAVLVLLLSCVVSTMVGSHMMHCWKMPLNSAESLQALKYVKVDAFWWLNSCCRQTTYCMSEYRTHTDIDRKPSHIRHIDVDNWLHNFTLPWRNSPSGPKDILIVEDSWSHSDN